eukprot:scaffold147252_cov21-Tisochrysis_lutea.AAC.5
MQVLRNRRPSDGCVHSRTLFHINTTTSELRHPTAVCPCRQVCDALGVELEVVPLTQAYWDSVVSHSVSQIRAGRTPNPDMLCNSRVKFGAFLDMLEARGALAEGPGDIRAQPGAASANVPSSTATSSSSSRHADVAPEASPMRFDRVASGHYARVLRDTDTPAALHNDRRVQGVDVSMRNTGTQAETVMHVQQQEQVWHQQDHSMEQGLKHQGQEQVLQRVHSGSATSTSAAPSPSNSSTAPVGSVGVE